MRNGEADKKIFFIKEFKFKSALEKFLSVTLFTVFTLKRVSSEKSLNNAHVVLPVPLLPITITFPFV